MRKMLIALVFIHFSRAVSFFNKKYFPLLPPLYFARHPTSNIETLINSYYILMEQCRSSDCAYLVVNYSYFSSIHDSLRCT